VFGGWGSLGGWEALRWAVWASESILGGVVYSGGG